MSPLKAQLNKYERILRYVDGYSGQSATKYDFLKFKFQPKPITSNWGKLTFVITIIIFVLMTNLHARRDELRRMKWPVSWRGGRRGRWQSLWSTSSWGGGGGGWQGQLWSLQLLGWINSLEGSPVRNQVQWGSWKWDVCRQCRQDAHLHLGFEINQQVWRNFCIALGSLLIIIINSVRQKALTNVNGLACVIDSPFLKCVLKPILMR